jgi:ribose transport system substrate-binding protein
MRSSMMFRALAAMLLIGILVIPASIRPVSAARSNAKAYTIYLSNNFIGNDYRVEMENTAQVLVNKAPYLGRVNLHIVNSDNTVASQVASLNNIIQTHPDAIIMEAVSPDALNATIARACAQGILVISFDQVITAPCAWKIDSDFSKQWPWTAEWLAATLHGKGTVFLDRGLPGLPLSLSAVQHWNAVFKKYPNIHSFYYSSQIDVGPEQSAVAALLTAHPDVDGILSEDGGLGALRALQIAGHKPVPISAASTNGLMLKCAQQHIPCMMFDNPDWLSCVAIRYAVNILDGKLPKAPQYIGDAEPPYVTNNVPIPGTKELKVIVGVNAYPNLPANIGLPVSPPWANITPQEALTGKV